jgi:hypothetical protein
VLQLREYGAYGRMSAWRPLAGLIGASATHPIPALAGLAGLAEEARYLLFHINAPWRLDIGIAVLRSGNRALAVLAATDCD